MTHNQTHRQWHRKALLFSLLILVVAIGCKKKDVSFPTPTTAESLVGTTWKENTNEKVETAKFKISFLTDSTFDCSQLKDKEEAPLIRIVHYADGITRNDTQALRKTRYIFDYKNGKGNIICKFSNYTAYWSMLTQNPYTEGYKRRLDKLEGVIATFTIDNNIFKLTYIDDTSNLNATVGLHPLRESVTIVKQ